MQVSEERVLEGSSKRSFVSADPGKCTGCSACEYACALEKEWSYNPLRSRIRVARFHPLFNVAMVCRFCENAPCVTACPRNALKQHRESGLILIDERKCDGCGWCIPACDYGAITLNPEKRVVMICDLCEGDAKCVDACPEEALELVTADEAAKRTWALAVDKLLADVGELAAAVKRGELDGLLVDADGKMKRLEDKLEALFGKELELQSKASS